MLMVTGENNQFMGVISFRDLATFLSVTMKIDHDKPVAESRKA